VRTLLLASNKGASDDEKLGAIQEIKRRTGASIAIQRREAVRPELRRMAVWHGRSVAIEAELNILASIVLAIEEIGEYSVDDVAAIGIALRRLVNDLATEGLIGTHWRLSARHESYYEEVSSTPKRGTDAEICEGAQEVSQPLAAKQGWTAQVETKLTVERLVKQGGLSRRERMVIAGVASGYDADEVSARMGIQPSTFRVLKRRALKKIEKIKK
jgi:hypothetical protein